MIYSQNNEQEIIANYFQGRKGTLLDIGANDGVTFSNSRHLMLNGWTGYLVEPSPSCVDKLHKLYADNTNVAIFNYAIVTEEHSGITVKFYINAPHIPNDDSLLSTAVPSEMERWKGLRFTEIEVPSLTYMDLFSGDKFDFITIDAEGMDLAILKQINLNASETQMVCVEYNGINPEAYIAHCDKYGLKEIHRNAENLIFAR